MDTLFYIGTPDDVEAINIDRIWTNPFRYLIDLNCFILKPHLHVQMATLTSAPCCLVVASTAEYPVASSKNRYCVEYLRYIVSKK